MKLSTNADIGLPAARVFAALSDFAGLERLAVRRGADLRRADALEAPGVGMAWKGTVPFRGKRREAAVELTALDPAQGLSASGSTVNFSFDLVVELLALSRERTRLRVGLDVRPRTLTARLLLQSARLGKGNLDRRFHARVAGYAKAIEERGSGRGG